MAESTKVPAWFSSDFTEIYHDRHGEWPTTSQVEVGWELTQQRANQRDWAYLGHLQDGTVYLRQQGSGRMQRYPLRYATVDARSQSAAKRIQTEWRKQGG